MDRNDVEIPKKKSNGRVIASSLISAVLFMIDLYVMMNRPGNYQIIVVVTILLLAGVYFFINAILQEMNESKKVAEEQYENTFKSGKASYLLLKKVLEQIEEIEEKSKPAASTQDIITAQKAIAKVIISRNKENTDALMNSNDKVLEKMFDIEEKLGAYNEELSGEQRNMIDDFVKELIQKQEELAFSIKEIGNSLQSDSAADNTMEIRVKELEDSLKNELNQIQSAVNALQEKMETSIGKLTEEMSRLDAVAATKPVLTEVPIMIEEPVVTEEPALKEIDFRESENLLEKESVFDSLDLGESENLLEEPALDVLDLGESENLLEEPALDVLDLGESENLLEEESILDSLDLGESENLLEEPALDSLDLGESENLLEEESILDVLDLGESENLLEEEQVLDSLDLGESENLLEEPTLDSLSLEESENLLGEEPILDSLDLGENENLLEEPNFDGLEPDQGDIILEEEKPVEEIVREEPVKKEPVKLDLSNPNKLMTPDEIAALIASM